MKKRLFFLVTIYITVFSVVANSYALLEGEWRWAFLLVPIWIFVNLFAGTMFLKAKTLRMRVCCHGLVLLLICLGTIGVSFLHHVILAFLTIPDRYQTLLWSLFLCFFLELFLFINGILCVYFTSLQLGVKQRVIAFLLCLIPGVNLIVLLFLIITVYREVRLEFYRETLNEKRKNQKVCRTKYPILMVHGFFFRDNKHFNYWGRIPKELEKNGATIFYGNHQSAAAIADSAMEIFTRVEEIVEQTGCEKVNIIAHSKGGLDCPQAITHLGMGRYVASLITVNTPHKGCIFADYLLTKIPAAVQNRVAATYNKTLKRLGDHAPDFLAGVRNLTASFCETFNQENPVPEGIYCKSIGTVLRKPHGGSFPLNLSYKFVKRFDGRNDGVVSESSFEWGENFTLLVPSRRHGISHADIIDLTRQDVPGFDVREFYVQMVSDLREKGL